MNVADIKARLLDLENTFKEKESELTDSDLSLIHI